MKVPHRFGLYGILSEPLKGYEYLARLFTDNQIRFIQLRMKKEPPEIVLKTALEIRKITEGSSSFFIVNDDPEIARASGADGVHLGQDDWPYARVRAALGPEKIIGLSTHSPAQTRAACENRPDYIGIGPVFPTPTKEKPDPVIGLRGMQEMIELASVPYVAIGGIDLSNLREVLGAGAVNFCMVRQLMKSEHPEKTLKEVLQMYKDFLPCHGAY